jgi:hypothetical protein
MKKSCFIGLLSMTMMCLFFILPDSSAYSQEGYGQQQQDMMHQPETEIQVSDSELDKIAQAYKEISVIRQDFEESLAGVEDPEAAQKMQEQAGNAMVEAVQNTGLDVQTYNDVMQAAQHDEELREKLLSRLEQMR